ncbi:MAG: hypothetical protein HYZ42_14610, partial [Bacteroidetes bacterium]|nr:hypothetical protein [Bacteroidota bacterium]
WSVATSLGSVTITTNKIRVTETSLGTSKAIGRSATLTGSYNSIGGGIVGSTIISNNNTTFNYFVLGDKVTLAGGTYTVGTTGTYANLTAVANELNSKSISGNVTFELTSSYTGTGETLPINFYNFDETGGNWTATIRVASSVSTRTLSGTSISGAPVISFNGVQDLTIDGRPGGTGSTSALIIRNTRTTATQGGAVEFVNDATNNTIKYAQIEAQAASATLGVVTIGSTTGTTGNDNNVIEYNVIKDYLTKLPVNLIYAAGNAVAPNDNNIIRNNQLINDSINAINITATGMGDNWTINDNSIFYNVGRNPSIAQTGIKVLAGSGHSIFNNYIGGQAVNCGGSAWTNTGNITFEAISLDLGTSSASNIYGNVIRNFSFTGSGTVNFNGISAVSGLMYIGTNGANVIGHPSTASSILLDATAGTFKGIQISNSASASKIENNTIANISCSNAAGSYTLAAIYSTGASINKNIIHSI